MKLIQFRVKNYRSINDSDLIEVSDRTALVGRNESGKTNLLLALASLNPPSRKLEELSYVKDFPRDRPASEFSPEVIAVESLWELSPDEQKQLSQIFPRATGVSRVAVKRPYKATLYVVFDGLKPLEVDGDFAKQTASKLVQSIRKAVQKEAEKAEQVEPTLSGLMQASESTTSKPLDWASRVAQAAKSVKEFCMTNGISVSETANGHLDALNEYTNGIVNDETAYGEAKKWIDSLLPIFIFLDEYPELSGHQSITQYLENRNNGQTITEPEKNFEKLVKVAGLNAKELQQLLTQDHEKRQQLANRAGAVVTKKIRELWTDRQLKVRFNLDAEHFDTLISDPSNVYDVEINLDERSRGFKWFFSFYITFAADTAGGRAENAILLLDEPGLFLHATAQGDLRSHFATDFENQILYTTHSPFMVPVDEIASVRTVNIAQDTGTIVSNDPTGDEKTLFPLRTAIGYELTQALFIGEHNLIVEGISDYWYLSSISEYLRDIQSIGLPPDLTITPAGGAQKVSYMVSLLTSHRLKVVVLFDNETQTRNTAEELIKAKLIRKENIVFVTEGLAVATDADIEDLIEPSVYDDLVAESYKQELKGVKLSLNSHIPRIVKRYEDAFTVAGLVFNKTRPAKLFLRLIAENPSSVMTATTVGQFQKLFEAIVKRQKTLANSTGKPFT